MSVQFSQSVNTEAYDQERLFSALAENIKQPLLQIARQAEIARFNNKPDQDLENIELTAESTLRLLDYYLLSTRLAQNFPSIVLEPVSISAILAKSAHELSKIAKQFNCELELHIPGKYEPIIAHKAGLEAAITSLGYVLIESHSLSLKNQPKPTIKFAAHRSHGSIVAGLFADLDGLGTDIFRKAKSLYGQARQPLSHLSTSGAGIFVADSLLASMSTRLRVAKHQNLSGLAATFTPSHQMSFIQ